MQNDKKIDELRKSIEVKRTKLGVKPRMSFVTNGVMPNRSKTINFNILRTEEDCFEAAKVIALVMTAHVQAETLLDCKEIVCMIGEYPAMSWVIDLKAKLGAIKWQEEKVKLDAMDVTLSGLLSEQAKTSNLINDIENSLK